MLKKAVQFVALIVVSTLLMSSCDAYITDSSESNSSAVTSEPVVEKADCSFEELFSCLFDAMETDFSYEEYEWEMQEGLREQQCDLNNDFNRARGIVNAKDVIQSRGDDYCFFVLIEYDMSSEEYKNMYVGDEITIRETGDFSNAETGDRVNYVDIDGKVTAIYGQFVLCLSDGVGYNKADYPPYLTDSGRSVYDTFIKIQNGEYKQTEVPAVDMPVTDDEVPAIAVASKEPYPEVFEVVHESDMYDNYGE